MRYSLEQTNFFMETMLITYLSEKNVNLISFM